MYAKQEKIKLEDSNLALYGSKLHTDLRKQAAQTEEEFKGAGKAPGIEVWRVEKLAIKRWPKEDYGKFFEGDSFIVLRTYKLKESDKLLYDVHFWLGQNTSQDESGVAAYKTVELDDLLDDLPVQYREVQGAETAKFMKLFDKIEIYEGGIETGFNRVKAAEYVARLLHVKGRQQTRVNMVKMELPSLNNGDVFVLDAGLKCWQWNGTQSNVYERRKAGQMMETLKIQRDSQVECTIIDGMEDDEEFWTFFGGKPEKVNDAVEGDEKVEEEEKLWKLSDEQGELSLSLVKQGNVSMSLLKNTDVFLFDVGYQIFVWVGSQASKQEKKNAMLYAMGYLTHNKLPVHTPIVRIVEGCIAPEFDKHFTAAGAYVAMDDGDEDTHKTKVKWQPKAIGAIEITVTEAKELADVQYLGKQDPFAKVVFGKKGYKTPVSEDTDLEAKWDHEPFVFELTGTDADPEEIGIEVLNKNFLLHGRIGDCTLRLADIIANKEAKAKWYALTRKGTQPAGSICISARFVPPTVIKVTEGRQLRSTQFIGKMDPYVQITIGKLRFKSMVHENGSKTPQWPEQNTFSFNRGALPEPWPKIEISVKNHNLIRDGTIGMVELDVANVAKIAGEGKDPEWVQLEKSEKTHTKAGEILVTFSESL